MTENDPFKDALQKFQCTRVELRGPNVTSSFDRPPRPDAVRAQQAAIRKHLNDRGSQGRRSPER